jgi:hypothetical protein
MNIRDALKSEDDNVRLENDCRWLVWSNLNKAWTVYEKLPYKHSMTMVIETDDEELAVEYLLQ